MVLHLFSLHPTLGSIIVEYKSADKPTDDILKQIEKAANFKIKEDLEIVVEEEDRAAAEAKYKAEPVNKQFIYEKRAPPAQITKLNILTIPGTFSVCRIGAQPIWHFAPVIPGWTIAAVASTDFSKRTSEIGNVVISKFKHRPQKSELELCFEVTDAPAPTPQTAKPTATSAPVKPSKDYNNTFVIAKELVDGFLASLEDSKVGVKLTAEQQEAVRKLLVAKTESTVNLVKNAAYASGFSAPLKK